MKTKKELQEKAFDEILSFLDQPFKKQVSYGQKTKWYKLISPNLNYRKVRGYCNTNTLAALLSAHINKIQYNLEIVKLHPAYSSIFQLAMTVAKEIPPCYWLTGELQSALMATDLPKHWVEIKPFIPYGFIFLPPIIRSPKGQFVEWIYFDFFSEDVTRKDIKINGLELNYGDFYYPEINWIVGVTGEISNSGTVIALSNG